MCAFFVRLCHGWKGTKLVLRSGSKRILMWLPLQNKAKGKLHEETLNLKMEMGIRGYGIMSCFSYKVVLHSVPFVL